MPNATVSEGTWDIIRYLFKDTRRPILDNPEVLAALQILMSEEILSFNYQVSHPPPPISSSDNRLVDFIRRYFPLYDVSTLGSWCSMESEPREVDHNIPLELHGRIVAALQAPQTENNYTRLKFLVMVIIIHYLGHLIAASFHGEYGYSSFPSKKFPYHVCPFRHDRKGKPKDVPDPGFIAEEAIFGGTVGVVFKDERNDGYAPFLLQADFTNISHFVVQRRDGRVYQIHPRDVSAMVEPNPFELRVLDPTRLKVASPRPRGFSERTCAFLNGDHIPVEFPGEGGELPRRRRRDSSDSYDSRRSNRGPSPRQSANIDRRSSRREPDRHEHKEEYAPGPSHRREETQETQETSATDTAATLSTEDTEPPRGGSHTPQQEFAHEGEMHHERHTRDLDGWSDLGEHREDIPGSFHERHAADFDDDLYAGLPHEQVHEPPPPHDGHADAPSHDGLPDPGPSPYDQEFPDELPPDAPPPDEVRKPRVEFAPTVSVSHVSVHEPEFEFDPQHEPASEPLLQGDAFPDPEEEITVPAVDDIPKPPPPTKSKGRKLKKR